MNNKRLNKEFLKENPKIKIRIKEIKEIKNLQEQIIEILKSLTIGNNWINEQISKIENIKELKYIKKVFGKEIDDFDKWFGKNKSDSEYFKIDKFNEIERLKNEITWTIADYFIFGENNE